MSNGRTASRPSCNGLPDCEPPLNPYSEISIATLTTSAIFMGENFITHTHMAGGYSHLWSSGAVSIIAPIVGNIILASIFVYIYIEWARRPRPQQGIQRGGCCDEGSNKDYTGKIRTWFEKGLIYGAAVGLLLYLPKTVYIWGQPTYTGTEIFGSLISGVVSFCIAGIIIAYVLRSPARGTADCDGES